MTENQDEGRQIPIGNIVVQEFQGIPKSSEECMDIIDTLARVEMEIEPHREIVKAGEKFKKRLYEKIEEYGKVMARPDSEAAPLFDQEGAESDEGANVPEALPDGEPVAVEAEEVAT